MSLQWAADSRSTAVGGEQRPAQFTLRVSRVRCHQNSGQRRSLGVTVSVTLRRARTLPARGRVCQGVWRNEGVSYRPVLPSKGWGGVNYLVLGDQSAARDYIRAEHKLQSISKLFIQQVVVPQVFLFSFFFFFFSKTTAQILSTILERKTKKNNNTCFGA